ncbi:conserved hypothetical protein [metagenome]|uniref:Rhodanese domain-containing protein n=1 Tax=metagenome TaxID=256318 RepID=A0A2P2BZC0_9ZZZZ
MSAITFEQLFLDLPSGRGDSCTLSARAAYQAVLGDDAVLVDLRPDSARRLHGSVAPELDPLVLSPAELGSLHGRVLLICADGRVALRTAEALRRLGVPGVSAVAGGYAAWRAAGMPTV